MEGLDVGVVSLVSGYWRLVGEESVNQLYEGRVWKGKRIGMVRFWRPDERAASAARKS